MFKSKYELNEKIHATILNPYLSAEAFKENCDVIKKFNIRNISSTFNYIKYLKESLHSEKPKISVFLSYPFSDLPQNFIDESIKLAKDLGVSGIEYTPKFFLLSKNEENLFATDLENISKSDLPVTCIFNKRSLEKNNLIKAINISLEVGIKRFQFGDGFNSSFTLMDINETLELLDEKNFIKVVGGIKDLNKVLDLLDAGVDCIGTTNFYEIFKEINQF